MRTITRMLLTAAATVVFLEGAALGDEPATGVRIKKWKADPVELFDRPDGAVVETRAAADLPSEAERIGQGWLKVKVGGRELFVESSQARTDLKLNGRPKCENLGDTTGYSASRGYGEEGCEP